jgi:hypothetical protein
LVGGVKDGMAAGDFENLEEAWCPGILGDDEEDGRAAANFKEVGGRDGDGKSLPAGVFAVIEIEYFHTGFLPDWVSLVFRFFSLSH